MARGCGTRERWWRCQSAGGGGTDGVGVYGLTGCVGVDAEVSDDGRSDNGDEGVGGGVNIGKVSVCGDVDLVMV